MGCWWLGTKEDRKEFQSYVCQTGMGAVRQWSRVRVMGSAADSVFRKRPLQWVGGEARRECP